MIASKRTSWLDPKFRAYIRAGVLLLAALGLGPAANAEQPLIVAGHGSVLEMAPMLVAANAAPAGAVVIAEGGIPSLWPSKSGSGAAGPGTDKSRMPDLAGNSETQALRQSVEHPDLRIIMTATEGMYRMIARRSSGITTLADLKGKRIATYGLTSAAYYLYKMLARAGLGESDVTIVSTTPEKGAQELAAGTVDALAMWEPEPERARRLLGGNAVELTEFGVYRELYNLNATTATLADPVKRRQIVAYVRSMLTACEEATYKPVRAQQLVAKRTGYDLTLIEGTWHHHRFACDLPSDLLDVLTEEEKWLAVQERRQPRDRAQLAGLIDSSILAEARKK